MNSFDYLDLNSYMSFAKNPENTQDAFNIQQLMIKHPNRPQMVQWAQKHIMEDPQFLTLYKNKYLPAIPSLDQLLAMPENTLGGAFGRHLKNNNINLLFEGLDTSMFQSQDVNELNYMSVRNYRNHDIYHVLMGVGTSPQDEYALFFLQLAQFGSPYHMVLLSAGMLHTVFMEPENIMNIMETGQRFYQIGKNAAPLVSFPYEDHWMTDLNEVRRMLRIEI